MIKGELEHFGDGVEPPLTGPELFDDLHPNRLLGGISACRNGGLHDFGQLLVGNVHAVRDNQAVLGTKGLFGPLGGVELLAQLAQAAVEPCRGVSGHGPLGIELVVDEATGHAVRDARRLLRIRRGVAHLDDVGSTLLGDAQIFLERLQRRLAGARGRWRLIRFSGEAGGRQPHGIQPSLQC